MRIPPPAYSTLFSCLYDELGPVGNFGRGTHYSVFRAVEWMDVERTRLSIPEVHDFSVIWDEDHDTRIIQVIEDIYMAGLLSPIQFIGERKGTLTIILAAKFYNLEEKETEPYKLQLGRIVRGAQLGDSWSLQVGQFDRSQPVGSHDGLWEFHHQIETKHLIDAKPLDVATYLKSIDLLWSLGTKSFAATLRALPWIPL